MYIWYVQVLIALPEICLRVSWMDLFTAWVESPLSEIGSTSTMSGYYYLNIMPDWFLWPH